MLRGLMFTSRRFASVKLDKLTFGNPKSEVTPLVMVPGLFGTKENWIKVGTELSKRLDCVVYAVENRNHGGSEFADSMTYAEMAEDIGGFVDWVRKETGHDQVNLHGHSMGGKSVMHLATTPEWAPKIKNLIVEDMSPLGYPPKRAEYMDCIRHMVSRDLNKSRDELMDEMREIVPRVLLYQFVRGNLGSTPDGRSKWTCNLDLIHKIYIDLLTNDVRFGVFDGPVLFQRASSSGFLPPSHQETINKMFPNVKFVDTCWSNHWIHADDPKFFVSSIIEFVSGKTIED